VAKQTSKDRRPPPKQEPYETVLMVCEGEKTEPQYFDRFIEVFNLSSANVRTHHPKSTDPKSLVDVAIEALEADPDLDKAFCIFDRDSFPQFVPSLRRVRDHALGKQRKLIAVPSVPCFELWFALHFRYSAKSYVAGGNRSPCDNLIRDLPKELANYKKEDQIFDFLYPHMNKAIKNAERLFNERDTTKGDPLTSVHDLVKYLANLKKTR
jgi:hypothetical protein